MASIMFFACQDIDKIRDFYINRLGFKLWLDQGTCIILQSGNQLLGFCRKAEPETNGIITIFFESKAEVDEAHHRMQDLAISAPKLNPAYRIYHFFARDPEGRMLEFQHFQHDLLPYKSAEECLMQRRSIRKYEDKPVPPDLLERVFSLCRWSPTARNLQAYYYIVIQNKAVLQKIVEQRGPAGKPILAAPLAIAVCASGELSRRVIQDACIAAYHLLLAAHTHGLGTCWVTDMDNAEVKALLGVPKEDYIACLTPLGYPAEHFELPPRRQTQDFVRYCN